MSDGQYKIVFAGDIADGHSIGAVQKAMAQLFKTDVERIAQLFNGETAVLKKNLDAANAKKYKAVLLKAGAHVSIEPMQNVAAQGIAQVETDTTTASEPAAQESDTGEWSLSPTGTDLLNVQEKKAAEVTAIEVNTDHLSMASTFDSAEDGSAAKPAKAVFTSSDLTPDTIADASEESPPAEQVDTAPAADDFSLADVGVQLVEPKKTEALDVQDLMADLAPPGADLGQAKQEEPVAPIDVSNLSLAPPSEKGLYADKPVVEVPAPPDTSHLSMEELPVGE